MSTETTNKKIKIDNGTTFGRTYTDKAVDELLKNVGGGGISVVELTDKNGTIASTQLGDINANPQNFAFKYNGNILLFTSADSTTYQYCNNTTSSSENNVMTTSTLLTITLSTGVYTIAENVHNVVANSIHPANGGNLTNIQVGSKVYSTPTDLIASANKLSLGAGNAPLGNGVNLSGFTYDEATKTLKAGGSTPSQTIYPLFVCCKKSQGYFSFTLPSLKPIENASGFFISDIFTKTTGLTHLSVAATGSWNSNPVVGFVYNSNKMTIYYWNATDKTVYSNDLYSLDFYYYNN